MPDFAPLIAALLNRLDPPDGEWLELPGNIYLSPRVRVVCIEETHENGEYCYVKYEGTRGTGHVTAMAPASQVLVLVQAWQQRLEAARKEQEESLTQPIDLPLPM